MKRRTSWPVLLIVLGLVLAACGGGRTSGPTPTTAYSVSGTVLNFTDNEPLAGVPVKLGSQVATTDDDGYWEFTNVKGTHNLSAGDTKYAACPMVVQVSGNETGIEFTAHKFNDGTPGDMAGSGTGTDPYVIRDVTQLQAMNDDLNAHYMLCGHIDASATKTWNDDAGFMPIGGVTKIVLNDNPYVPLPPQGEGFNGSLNGRDYEIRNLYMNMPDGKFAVEDPYDDFSSAGTAVGLFQWIGKHGVVQNIRLVNGEITGELAVGAVAGFNDGLIESVHNLGTKVQGELHSWPEGDFYLGYMVGGLVGHNDGDIVAAHNAASVVGGEWVGGIAGDNMGLIHNPSNSGTVAGDANVGGIAGGNGGLDAFIEGATNTGTVQGLFPADGGTMGGIVGVNSSRITDAHNDASVSGGDDVGGIAGLQYVDGSIERSRNTGDVEGVDHAGGVLGRYQTSGGGVPVQTSFNTGNVGGAKYVGGILGEGMNSTFVNVYNFGDVTGQEYVGGIIGRGGDEFQRVYNVGAVTGDSSVGGISGAGSRDDTQAHYDKTKVTGPANTIGQAKTDEQLRTASTYEDWDKNGWFIQDGQYPDLADNPR